MLFIALENSSAPIFFNSVKNNDKNLLAPD